MSEPFNCDGCGALCCKYTPIEIFEDEYNRLKEHFIDPTTRFKLFQKGIHRRFFILPECPFLENDQCSIYDERPRVCRIFPVMVGGKEFILQNFCPKSEPIIKNEQGDLLLENLEAAIKIMHKEFVIYDDMHPLDFEQYKRDIKVLDIEVREWINTFHPPEHLRNKGFFKLNKYTNIPILKPYVEGDKTE